LILFLFLGSVKVLAHGVQGEIRVLQGVVVARAWYDTGEPMSYARAEVWAPNSRVRFQIARTDRHGRLAFVPDSPGKWRVVFSDELGHRIELVVNISKLSLEKVTLSQKPVDSSRGARAFLGVFLILGFFGWLREILVWVGRQK